MEILIVGAGIAGLTAASALAAGGHVITIVDRRTDWDVTGWGLSLTGPALRALSTIGVARQCVEQGYGIGEIATWTRDGQLQRAFAPPRLAGPDLPAQVGIMRTVLHRILLDRANEGGVKPELGQSIAAADEGEGKVNVIFADGSSGTYDLVVGADGVHSVTRDIMGLAADPRYLGQVAWRVLVDRADWCDRLCTFAGTHYVAGMIPISQTLAYIWLLEPLADPKLERTDDRPAVLRELLSEFTGPMAAVRETIVDPRAIVRRQVDVHLVEQPWHRGRMVLIGDAVHAPSPQLVSGAALSIEDAVVLADELSRHEPERALTAYFTRRIDRCRLVYEACVAISELQLADRTADWTKVQAETFAALADPA